MKMKFVHVVLFVLLIAIVSSLATGCFATMEGVPESVILSSDICVSFSQTHENTTFGIVHDVDSDAHTDTVTLTMNSDTDYATLSETATLQYQYQKSDDLWILLDTDDNPYPSITLKEDNLISQSPWQGKTNNYYSGNPNYSYILYVEAVDTQAHTMVVSYEIDYENDKYPDHIVEHRRVSYEHIIGNDYYTFLVAPDGNWRERLQIFTVGCDGIEAYDY